MFLLRKGEYKAMSQTEDDVERRGDASSLFHKGGQETRRLDFQHYGLKLLMGTNYKAPLNADRVRNILDVGSGTGRWMLEMSREYPDAYMVGIDIELPEKYIVLPLRCHIEQFNILNGLPFQYDTFQYVHQRLLAGSIPMYVWPMHIQELVRVLSPGGWLELLETGNIFHDAGPATTRLLSWWDSGVGRATFDRSFIAALGILLTGYGMQNVHTDTFVFPLGKWGGRGGELMGMNMCAAFKSMKGLFVEQLGVNEKRFDTTLAKIREEWEVYQTTCEFYNITATKG